MGGRGEWCSIRQNTEIHNLFRTTPSILIPLFRTKDKIHAVQFLNHLLAIAIQQKHGIVTAFVYLEYKQI